VGTTLWDIKLADQLDEPIGNALPDNIVVHGAQLMTDSGLDLGIQAALLFLLPSCPVPRFPGG